MNGIKFGLFLFFFWELGQIRSNMMVNLLNWTKCLHSTVCQSHLLFNRNMKTLQLQIRTVWFFFFLILFYLVNEGQCDPIYLFWFDVSLVSLKASFRKSVILRRKQHGVSSSDGVYVCIYSMYVHACTFTHSVAVIVIWSTVQRLYLFIVL